MPASSLAPRWRRLWPIFAGPVLFVVLAVAWSIFWFATASQVDEKLDGWRSREARAGRTYDCANRTVAGFPFRLEVRCENPVVTLQSQTPEQAARRTQITARLRDILVIAQIYDPTKIIAEFTGPAVVGNSGTEPLMVANWSVGRASVAGLPSAPQRISMVFDEPALDRIGGAIQVPLLRAKHLELHTRLLEGSPGTNPVIETVLQLTSANLPDMHPLLAEPLDADIRAQLRGLKNFSPKSWPERFREIQAANGRLDFTQSRIQQGDMIAVATGSLGINANGFLVGELQMTVAGIEKIVPKLGLDKILAEGASQATVDRVAPGVNAQDVNKVIGALDRVIPGFGNAARKNTNTGVIVGLSLLGQPATLEGRKAQAFPVKFIDGAVFVGPFRIAQTPPLF